jgi:hypothetical protein
MLHTKHTSKNWWTNYYQWHTIYETEFYLFSVNINQLEFLIRCLIFAQGNNAQNLNETYEKLNEKYVKKLLKKWFITK